MVSSGTVTVGARSRTKAAQMTLSIGKGYSVDYVTRNAMRGRENYHLRPGEKGLEPAGRWTGRGLEDLGLERGSDVDPDVLRQMLTGVNVGGKVQYLKPDGTPFNLSQQPHSYKFDDLEKKIQADVQARLDGVQPEMRTGKCCRDIEFEVRSKAGRAHVNFYEAGGTTPKSVGLVQQAHALAAENARRVGDEDLAAYHQAEAEWFDTVLYEAADKVVETLEDHLKVRTGRHSVTRTPDGQVRTGEWRDGKGVTAATFLHHTARTAKGAATGDPHLHGHILIDAKVLRADLADELARMMDSSESLYSIRGELDNAWESVVRQRVQERYGIAVTGDGAWEIDGVPASVIAAHSQRTREVSARLQETIDEFITAHDRMPHREAIRHMKDAAWGGTRQAKGDAPDRMQQLETWDAQARAASDKGLVDLLADVTAAARNARTVQELDAAARMQCIEAAVGQVQQGRAAWTTSQLEYEISRQLPSVPGTAQDRLDLIRGMAADTMRGRVPGIDIVPLTHHAVPQLPGATRDTGESIYHKPSESAKYATLQHLEKEQEFLRLAQRARTPHLTPERAARALGTTVAKMEAEIARQGRDNGAEQGHGKLSGGSMTDDQDIVLYGILTGTAAVSALTGMPGVGKSRAMEKLNDILERETGGRLIMVTSGTAQAAILRGMGIRHAYSIADFLGYIEPGKERAAYMNARAGGRCRAENPAPLRRGHVPISSRDIVGMDEAGQPGLAEHLEVAQATGQHGASFLEVGDPNQIGSVTAGGILELLVSRGAYYEMHEAKRYEQQWQADVAVRLRDGDVSIVQELRDRGLIVEGDWDGVARQAARDYAGSLVAGRTALLHCQSNEDAARLAAVVRNELIEVGEVAAARQMQLADGNDASTGDLLRCRRNDSRIDAGGEKRTIRNRDVVRVDAVHGRDVIGRRLTGIGEDGQKQFSEPFLLPLRYLAQSGELAYTQNHFVSIGETVQDNMPFFTRPVTADVANVALTRDRHLTTAYCVTEKREEGVLEPGKPRTVPVTTAEAMLTASVDTPGEDFSATRELERSLERAYSLPELTGKWVQLTGRDSEERFSQVLRDKLPEDVHQRLEADKGRDLLLRHLRSAEINGHDAAKILEEASGSSFTGARSIADVLHGRVTKLTPAGEARFGSYEAATPASAGPEAMELARLADARVAELGERAARDRPIWALRTLGEPPREQAARDEWTTRAGRISGHRELVNFRHPVDVLPEPPGRGSPLVRASYLAAAGAAGITDQEQEAAAASDVLLGAWIRDYERMAQFAPSDVTEQLKTAQAAARVAATDARLEFARAEHAPDAEAEVIRGQAVVMAENAMRLGEQVRDLAAQDELYRGNLRAATPDASKAAAARAELAERYPVQEAAEPAEEQLVMSVTGEEAEPELAVAGEAVPVAATAAAAEATAERAVVQEAEAAAETLAVQPELGLDLSEVQTAAEIMAQRNAEAEATDPQLAEAAHWERVQAHRDAQVIRAPKPQHQPVRDVKPEVGGQAELVRASVAAETAPPQSEATQEILSWQRDADQWEQEASDARLAEIDDGRDNGGPEGPGVPDSQVAEAEAGLDGPGESEDPQVGEPASAVARPDGPALAEAEDARPEPETVPELKPEPEAEQQAGEAEDLAPELASREQDAETGANNRAVTEPEKAWQASEPGAVIADAAAPDSAPEPIYVPEPDEAWQPEPAPDPGPAYEPEPVTDYSYQDERDGPEAGYEAPLVYEPEPEAAPEAVYEPEPPLSGPALDTGCEADTGLGFDPDWDYGGGGYGRDDPGMDQGWEMGY